MRVVVFDVWGDFAHFRKFYTTTSPLSFPFPPPPTVAGLLGAIYGTSKLNGHLLINKYLEVFGYDKCKIAVRIINPIEKIRQSINLLDTKSSPNNFRTQIKTEFIRNPKYRLYVSHEDDEIMTNLEKKLKNHAPVYSVSLGLAYLLANFQYVDTFAGEPVRANDYEEISSIIPLSKIDDVDIERAEKIFREKIPVHMTPERVVKKYEFVVFNPDGKPLSVKSENILRLDNGEKIIFF
ncbi:MAG: type I-B CRISPR-associated protein Cas5 [Chlorobi bacterium]|nr:type I-B CRISPR-associated protein Cas5 [Chlorobiota bacterium]